MPTTKTTTDAAARAAAIAWRHAQQASYCETLEPWEHGSVARTPSAPGYWDANFVRVERDPGPDADALIAAADRLQSGLSHRKLEVEDETAGARLLDAFRAAGWLTERLAVMLREGPPPAADPEVAEVPLADTRALRLEWFTDGDGDVGDIRRLVADQDRLAEGRGLRAFVVRDASGRPVAFATLVPGEGAVELQQVYVTPARRGRGLGRRLIESALAAGGEDVAWIVADDDDRPRALYERLGFRTVWLLHAFTRLPR